MIPFVWVDSFTSEAFAGNPAAVCFLPGERDAAWMQKVAREMNLAETAFLRPLDGEGGRREFELRWFTPTVEVDLCGHATLASAHALWESGRLAPTETARFHTRSGLPHRGAPAPTARRWIQMDFPLTKNDPVPAPDGLLEALGVGTPLYVGRSRFDYLVEVESEAALRGVAPDLRRLSAIEARGVIVTSRAADPDYDFVSRFFAPRSGIDEDPVTGSAHCTLADFWSRQLGKTRVSGPSDLPPRRRAARRSRRATASCSAARPSPFFAGNFSPDSSRPPACHLLVPARPYHLGNHQTVLCGIICMWSARSCSCSCGWHPLLRSRPRACWVASSAIRPARSLRRHHRRRERGDGRAIRDASDAIGTYAVHGLPHGTLHGQRQPRLASLPRHWRPRPRGSKDRTRYPPARRTRRAHHRAHRARHRRSR